MANWKELLLIAIVLFSVQHVYGDTCSNLSLDLKNAQIAIMGRYSTSFDVSYGVGRFTVGYVDNLFLSKDILVYENTAGNPGAYQWLGWISGGFTNQVVHVTVWLKFLDQVPSKSNNFGIKIYGNVHNDFLASCRPNVWCKASVIVKNPIFGDSGAIYLIFDTIAHKQKVLIPQLKLEIDD